MLKIGFNQGACFSKWERVIFLVGFESGGFENMSESFGDVILIWKQLFEGLDDRI